MGKKKATNRPHKLERVGAELDLSLLVRENAVRLAIKHANFIVVLIELCGRTQ